MMLLLMEVGALERLTDLFKAMESVGHILSCLEVSREADGRQ